MKEEMSQLERAFWSFHDDNPHVYGLFRRFTDMLISSGWVNYSAAAVIHRIRWETAIKTNDPSFKINNNFSPYYARLWMRDHPEHDGFFRTRELRDGETSDALSRAA